jgi:hypothetical protein
MTEETNNEVVKLTPEILQGLIEECINEQDKGTGPLLTESQDNLVKLDLATLKYFVYETLKERRRGLLLEYPSLCPEEAPPPLS